MKLALNNRPIYQPFPNYNYFTAGRITAKSPVQIPVVFKWELPGFIFFVENLLSVVQIDKGTATLALIYSEKILAKLTPKTVMYEDCLHRVFTGALRLACKITKEKWKNSHFSEGTNHFYSMGQISQFEFQAMTILEDDIFIKTSEVRQYLKKHATELFWEIYYP